MSRLERISQICLYMGALLLVLLMDWHWYAKHYPSGNPLLKVELFPVIYAVFAAGTIGCLGLAAYFNWKSTPRHIGHKDKRKNQRKRK